MAKKKPSFESAFLALDKKEEVTNVQPNEALESVIEHTEKSVEYVVNELPEQKEDQSTTEESIDQEEIKEETIESQEAEIIPSEQKTVIKNEVATTSTVITPFNRSMSEEEVFETIKRNMDILNSRISKIEEMIKFEKSSKYKILNKKRKYSEKYIGVTLSVRPEILEVIDDLRDVLVMDKYEIIEKLLMTGLKYANFDE